MLNGYCVGCFHSRMPFRDYDHFFVLKCNNLFTSKSKNDESISFYDVWNRGSACTNGSFWYG